jgi:mRNA interferase RelE/StbE
MIYAVNIQKQAKKKLLSLAAKDRSRLAEAIHSLASDPDSDALDVKQMKGMVELRWRMRVGNWRVIYDRDDELCIIDIERIGARGDVYK